MAQQRWETQSGLPTVSLMYGQLLEHLIQAQENAAMLAHLTACEDGLKDKAVSNGWLMISEQFKRIETVVTMLAQGRLS